MSVAKRRAATLKRVRRLREIEAIGVKRELAEARSNEARMRDLYQRTGAMALDYSNRITATHAIDLRDALGLSRSLAKLSDEAFRMEGDAQAAARKASQTLAQLDHQQDRLDERIKELERAEQTRLESQNFDGNARLARSLLSNS